MCGRPIGFPDFQVDNSRRLSQERLDQLARHSLAARFRGHGKVQELGFTLHECTRHQESRHANSADRDAEVVPRVVGDVPLGSLGAGGLDDGDLGEVAWSAAADYPRYILGA